MGMELGRGRSTPTEWRRMCHRGPGRREGAARVNTGSFAKENLNFHEHKAREGKSISVTLTNCFAEKALENGDTEVVARVSVAAGNLRESIPGR
jgi:hypothetical protein